MISGGDFLYPYLIKAPIPLAVERSLECEILSAKEFSPPILDLGCGDGLFARILFQDKVDVGIDPNKKELEHAGALDVYKELIPCFGDMVPKTDGYFKTIFSNSVLEHIPDLHPVLREAYRLLSPGGRFYVTIPTDMFDRYNVLYQFFSFLGWHSMAERYRSFFNAFWKHYHYHDPEEWRKIFEGDGFKTVEYAEYDCKSIAVLNDALVPFSVLGMVNKRLFNRWTILPSPLRKVYILPFFYFLKKFLGQKHPSGKGGLVYFCFTK